MKYMISIIACHLKFPSRLQNVATLYLISLMVRAPKHSLTFASAISGLNKSQFSRFLSKSSSIALANLNRLIRLVLLDFLNGRKPLIPGSPWTVALIIDATIQKRSSRHTHNAQKFNHGKGFVIGHQWTNIVLLINGIVIPLPPLKFLSKKTRIEQGLPKETEHEAIIRFILGLHLNDLIGPHRNGEVVVLLDAGYDNKKIQNTIIGRGWDFVAALKCSRGSRTSKEYHNNYLSRRVDDIFWACRKNAAWQTIRDHVNGWKSKKRKDFRGRELIGYLAGLPIELKLVLSEERGSRKGRKFLACSNPNISLGTVIRVYRKRWAIELFHKEVKSFLGFEDVSCHNFASVEAHVYWVYSAYLLLRKLFPSLQSVSERMDAVERELEKQTFRDILQKLTRFGGYQAVKSHCLEVIRGDVAA